MGQCTVLRLLMLAKPKKLIILFCVIMMSGILYALPAWGGFLTADLIAKIYAFYAKQSAVILKFLSCTKLTRNYSAQCYLMGAVFIRYYHPTKIIPMKLQSSQCVDYLLFHIVIIICIGLIKLRLVRFY